MLSFSERLEAIGFDMNTIPKDFIDCVSLSLMENPVVLPDGHIYDEDTAIDLLSRPLVDRKSPKTREPLKKELFYFPLHDKRAEILTFVEEQERLYKYSPENFERLNQQVGELKAELDTVKSQAKGRLKKEQEAHKLTAQKLSKAEKALKEANKHSNRLEQDLKKANQSIKEVDKQNRALQDELKQMQEKLVEMQNTEEDVTAKLAQPADGYTRMFMSFLGFHSNTPPKLDEDKAPHSQQNRHKFRT